MSYTPTILGQVLKKINRLDFSSVVQDTQNDRYVKRITSWKLLVFSVYAQLGNIESLRHLASNIAAFPEKLFHLGIDTFGLSSLSYALANRPAAAYREYFYRLLAKTERERIELDKDFIKNISIVDSTSMPISGSGSEWAQGGKSRREARAHVLLDYNGMPLDMVVTGASSHELTGFKNLKLGTTEVLLMDRAYYSYALWKKLIDKEITFITRAKKNMKYNVLKSKRGRKLKDVLEDQIIEFAKPRGVKEEKIILRRIVILTCEGYIPFITNDLKTSATIIADLYKARWEIESFFKWIKQNLKIKKFLGRSQNAIEIQLWVAMIIYLILWMIKKSMKIDNSLIEILRSINAKLMMNEDLTGTIRPKPNITYKDSELIPLFNSSGH